MKASVICSLENQGFSGFFYPAPCPDGRCMVILAGDLGNDFLSQAFARWFTKHQNISALCLDMVQDPSQAPGVSLWNLNTVTQAVSWLHSRDYRKLGICGISMQAVIALSAAARIPDLSLAIGFAPCDYVPWGFQKGPLGKSKNAEFPTGKSLLTWKCQPRPFQEAGMEKEEYWRLFQSATREHGEMYSKAVFDRSEELHRISPDAFIPAENIRGPILLIGAEDDSMWNSTKYILRLAHRLREKEFMFPCKCFTYAHGTHLLLPQRMVTDALPVVGGLVSLLFQGGRRHPFQCAAARKSLDRKLSSYLDCW